MATPMPTPATRMTAWRRVTAALCIALATAQHAQVNAQAASDSDSSSTPSNGGSSIPFGVGGVATSAPINGSGSRNAAVQPQTHTVTLDELRSLVNRSRSDNGVAFLNPFSRVSASTPTPTTATSTPEPTATRSNRNNSSSSTNSSTPAPSTSAPSATLANETSTATVVDGTDRVEGTAPLSDSASSSSSSSFTEGFSRARARPNAGRPTETPTPAPQDDDELWFESPSPSVSKKSTNAISFDVVRPPSSSSDSGETDATTTTQAPSVTPATQAPSTSPTSTPPTTPTVTPTTKPVEPTTPTTTLPSSTAPGREGQNPNLAPGTNTNTAAPSDKGVALLAEAAPTAPVAGGGQPGLGHSSFSGEPTVGHSKKGNSTTAGSSSSAESTESSNQSGSSLYSMGTASIMSIVGVIVGICVIVSLFVLISRRKYENDDDDHDVLNYGGGGIKFNLDGRGTNSIVRLSPTFLMNDMAAPAPGQPMEPDFGSMSPHQIIASNRGRAPTGAVPEQSPAIMENFAPQQRNLASEGGPSPSAFDSTDDFSTLDSRGSDGWSSVLESDFDHRSASRCTRDTTFSNITMSQNYSEFNPADLRSGTFRSTTAPRRPGGDSAGTYRRTTKGSSQVPEYDIDEETASVMSFDVDEGNNVNDARSTGASSFRMSGYSDFRSTGQSFDQSLRSTGPYM